MINFERAVVSFCPPKMVVTYFGVPEKQDKNKKTTMRGYPNAATIERFDNSQAVYLEEKIRDTVQLVVDSEQVL